VGPPVAEADFTPKVQQLFVAATREENEAQRAKRNLYTTEVRKQPLSKDVHLPGLRERWRSAVGMPHSSGAALAGATAAAAAAPSSSIPPPPDRIHQLCVVDVLHMLRDPYSYYLLCSLQRTPSRPAPLYLMREGGLPLLWTFDPASPETQGITLMVAEEGPQYKNEKAQHAAHIGRMGIYRGRTRVLAGDTAAAAAAA